MSSTDASFDDALIGPSWTIRIIGVVVLLFSIWAAFAWVDEIVRADGQVVSSSRSQIIQNLEGGILAELKVGQGDLVEAGQVLARLQDTKFQASVGELQDQIDALEISIKYRSSGEGDIVNGLTDVVQIRDVGRLCLDHGILRCLDRKPSVTVGHHVGPIDVNSPV